MNEIAYFDSFVMIGRYAAKDPKAPWRDEDLAREMTRCRVQAALVFSNVAKEQHPHVGNPLVLETCRKNQRLFPGWVGVPNQSGEYLDAGSLVREMVG